MESMSLIEIALEIKCASSEVILNQDKINSLSKRFHEKSYNDQELKKLKILLGNELHSTTEFALALKSLDAMIELISKGGQYEKTI